VLLRNLPGHLHDDASCKFALAFGVGKSDGFGSKLAVYCNNALVYPSRRADEKKMRSSEKLIAHGEMMCTGTNQMDMRKIMKNMKTGVFCLLALALVWGCSDQGTDPGRATMRIFVTDAVGLYDAVNITFTEVSAHIGGQWVTISNQTQTVNLLDWNNGNILQLGQADVQAGTYTQIRLKIASAEVVLNGTRFDMTVPSGATSGLKLNAKFDVAAGSTYDIVLDFDAERSVVVTGPVLNPTGFNLKPVIRATAIALTGSISGTVTNPTNLPVAYAISGTDTITSSPVDTTGFFRLAFLPPATYTVSIVDTLNRKASQTNVLVTAGQDFPVGPLTLQ
jgi:hypothetical protein